MVIEHFSDPPGAADLATALLKTAWTLEQWLLGRLGSASRPPLGLVVSVGRPVSALRHFQLLRPAWPSGVYRTTCDRLEMILVDVRNLARVPGTGFLGLFDHRPEVVEENLRRLSVDPGMEKLVKDAIGAAIMKEPTLFDFLEKKVTWEECLDSFRERGLEQGRVQGLEQGRVQGLERGREEGRELQARSMARRLLVARLRSLPAELEAALDACKDADALARTAELAVSPEPDAQVARRALELLRPA